MIMIVRPKSEGNSCTYDLAERYRLMQSICRTRLRLQRYTFSIKHTIAYDMLYHKKRTTNHSNTLIINTWYYRQLSPLRTFCSFVHGKWSLAHRPSGLSGPPDYPSSVFIVLIVLMVPRDLRVLTKKSHIPLHLFAYVKKSAIFALIYSVIAGDSRDIHGI